MDRDETSGLIDIRRGCVVLLQRRGALRGLSDTEKDSEAFLSICCSRVRDMGYRARLKRLLMQCCGLEGLIGGH
jgi:hypothetical protein